MYNTQIMLGIMFGNNYKEKYIKAFTQTSWANILEKVGTMLKKDIENWYVIELKQICKGGLEEDIDVWHIFSILERNKIDLS